MLTVVVKAVMYNAVEHLKEKHIDNHYLIAAFKRLNLQVTSQLRAEQVDDIAVFNFVRIQLSCYVVVK